MLFVRVIAAAIGARTENGGRTAFLVATLKRERWAFLAAFANTAIFVRFVRRIDHRIAERIKWQALAIARPERQVLGTLVPFALRFVRAVQTVGLAVTNFGFGYAVAIGTLEGLFWAVVSDALGFVAIVLTVRLVVAQEVPGDASAVSALKRVRIAARIVLGITL